MSKQGLKHDISFFSRYIFCVSARCKVCNQKVTISHSIFSGWLCIGISSIIVLYLWIVGVEGFNFIVYATLWVALAFFARKYMVFGTQEEHKVTNSTIEHLSVLYLLLILILQSIVMFTYEAPLIYTLIFLSIIAFVAPPASHFAPTVEKCERKK